MKPSVGHWLWVLSAAPRLFGALLIVGPGLSWGGAAEARSWDDIVKAAEKEGEVVVVSPPVKPHRATVSLFQKAYPKIKLKVTGMNSPQWEPRLAAERKSGVYVWDVLVTGLSLAVYYKQIPEGWYDPLDPLVRADVKDDSLWLGGWRGGYLDKGQTFAYGFAGNLSNNFMIDRAQIPESKLSTLQDFLKPEFKGKIAMYDPRHRGPGGYSITQASFILGESGIRKLLSEQDVVVTSTFRQLLEWSVRGRYPIVIGAPLGNILDYQVKGIGTSVKALDLPKSAFAVGPSWGGLLAVNRAPHPNAARVFIHWMLSKEAQADWAKRGGVNSRRLDVPKGMPALAPSAEDWRNGLALSSEKYVDVRRKYLEVAREELKK